MNLLLAGHEGSGMESLAQSIRRLSFGGGVRPLSLPIVGEDPQIGGVDTFVLAVNLLEGSMPGTREALILASQQGWKLLGFLLTRDDEFNARGAHGPHIKELVEMEARELASIYGYRDENLPALRVSIPADERLLGDFLRQVIR